MKKEKRSDDVVSMPPRGTERTKSTTELQPLLKAVDVARLLRRSVYYVYRNKHRIPHIKLGVSGLRWRREDLLRYLDSHVVGAKS